jgi:hypothetical protein
LSVSYPATRFDHDEPEKALQMLGDGLHFVRIGRSAAKAHWCRCRGGMGLDDGRRAPAGAFLEKIV